MLPPTPPLVFRQAPRAGLEITPAQAEAIGRLIWRNEGAGKPEALVHWNDGEAFPSLGIGHFIWYPEGVPQTFQESFPALRDFLGANGVALPSWTQGACPWPDKPAFLADAARRAELRAVLEATFSLQARFIANRAIAALPGILEAAPAPTRPLLEARHASVARTPNGVYALVDYVNFKGEGVDPAERYNGQGWGLLQVLQEMRADGVAEFSAAAERVLARRVANSPAERHESRWLPGWTARVRTYLEPL